MTCSRRLFRHCGASATVEMALVLPIMLLLIIGSVDPQSGTRTGRTPSPDPAPPGYGDVTER